MNKTILLPLVFGLLVAGCTRSKTDSQTAANDKADPNTSQYDSKAAPAAKDTAASSQVAATPTPPPATPTPAPGGREPATATPKGQPDSSAVAATPPAPPAGSQPTSDAGITPARVNLDVSARVAEWKLKPDEIKSELETSGRIVRSRPAREGEPTGPMDDILAGLVTGRLQADSDTTALKLDVSAARGVITLKGTADSLDKIGKAIALSLDTAGVTETVSEIKLEPQK